jgi:hypothetical protein
MRSRNKASLVFSLRPELIGMLPENQIISWYYWHILNKILGSMRKYPPVLSILRSIGISLFFKKNSNFDLYQGNHHRNEADIAPQFDNQPGRIIVNAGM